LEGRECCFESNTIIWQLNIFVKCLGGCARACTHYLLNERYSNNIDLSHLRFPLYRIMNGCRPAAVLLLCGWLTFGKKARNMKASAPAWAFFKERLFKNIRIKAYVNGRIHFISQKCSCRSAQGYVADSAASNLAYSVGCCRISFSCSVSWVV